MGNKNVKELSTKPSISQTSWFLNRLDYNGQFVYDKSNLETKTRMVVVTNYEAQFDHELSVKTGQILLLLDASNYEFDLVNKMNTDEFGFVPKNVVKKIDYSNQKNWYAGQISQSEADFLVSQSFMPVGTFLIREQNVDPDLGDYVLTINGESAVEHHVIHILDKFGGVYITTKKIFHSLIDLVVYYSNNSDNLCSKLILPAMIFKLDLLIDDKLAT
uniref:SH2 domain-containing protein n=1 Tax=Panagrolaimus sp. JU765 TaxID=591449 RepID=A0AC34R786_9BILA